MMFTNNQTYVPLISTKKIFNFESIEWDEEENSVNIVTDGVTVAVNTTIEETDANVAAEPEPPMGGQGGPGGYGGGPMGGPMGNQ
ncbi:MAG: hypothetical protein LUD77_03135 [Clostridiales bacterium]|nr:hypothetical protein [Clostridiales bacterium]